MSVVAILPARYGSTRFPAKPLARETGKFLIQHVFERARQARRIDRVLVATDDERIAEAVRSFGGEAVMTRADHATGTDRIAEVARGLAGARGDDLLLNVQGDEPEIDPDVLDRLVQRMQARPDVPMGTLACPFPAESRPESPHCVKVVVNEAGCALYFSRSVIPYVSEDARDANVAPWLLHLGVYAYRRDFLLQFAGWPRSPLERLERLEQLRVLDRGHPILVERVAAGPAGIDTPEEYAEFVARWRRAAVS